MMFNLMHCNNNKKEFPTMILSLCVKDHLTNSFIDSASITQYSPTAMNELHLGFTNEKGFSCDTIRHIITMYQRGVGSALYYPENIIISKRNYKTDTLELTEMGLTNSISYFESLGDSTVKIDLGVIYLEPVK